MADIDIRRVKEEFDTLARALILLDRVLAEANPHPRLATAIRDVVNSQEARSIMRHYHLDE